MSLFLTSDLHFGHHNIIEYCRRPYDSVEQMNSDLIARWNATVNSDDDVIVVGDVCMGRLEDSLRCVSELNGHKLLIPGNHDRMFKTDGDWYEKQCERYLDAGFEEVLDSEIDVELPNGTVALVCHFPYLYDDEPDDGHEGRFPEMRPTDEGGLLIHGHQHGVWRRKDRMIDVGVDAWGGRPVSADTIAATFAVPETDLTPLHW